MNPRTTRHPSQAEATVAAATGTTATASAAGTVSWSFPSPTATPPPGTASTTSMDVVPGSGMDAFQRYEYTGRELASESGEYYFRYRVHGPALGQFFTRDPLGYVDGMGLYAGMFAEEMAEDPAGESSSETYTDIINALFPSVLPGIGTDHYKFDGPEITSDLGDFKICGPDRNCSRWSVDKPVFGLGLEKTGGFCGRLLWWAEGWIGRKIQNKIDKVKWPVKRETVNCRCKWDCKEVMPLTARATMQFTDVYFGLFSPMSDHWTIDTHVGPCSFIAALTVKATITTEAGCCEDSK